MTDDVAEILRKKHAEALADALGKREDFFDAIELAYQDKKQAEENIAYALGRWGVGPTLEILENQPWRIGVPRGAWYTPDRYAQGGNERARVSGGAIEKLPELARIWGAADDIERRALNTYLDYCEAHGIEPDLPGRFGPGSVGAARVPAHQLWEPRGGMRDAEAVALMRGERQWWRGASQERPMEEPKAAQEREWWRTPGTARAEPERAEDERERGRDRDRDR